MPNNVIKQLGIYQNNAWKLDDIGADAVNVSLTTPVAGEINVQNALSRLCGQVALEPNRVIITNDQKTLTHSEITSTQLNYLKNLDGDIANKFSTLNNQITSINGKITNVESTVNNYIAYKQTNNGNNYSAYWKFNDGTLICAKTIETTVSMTKAFGSMYETSSAISFGNWPLAFKQQPYISVSCVKSNGVMCIIEKIMNASATSAGSSYLLSPISRSNQTIGIHITGIGRWK